MQEQQAASPAAPVSFEAWAFSRSASDIHESSVRGRPETRRAVDPDWREDRPPRHVAPARRRVRELEHDEKLLDDAEPAKVELLR